MKKIIIKILLILTIFTSFWLDIMWNTKAASWIIVEVTEYIPGTWCNPKPSASYTWTYICTVEPWFESVVGMMWEVIIQFTFLVSLAWVLFIVYNGIMYSMGWMEQSLKDDAKKRIIQTIIWLIVLFLSWAILYIVAPWVYDVV